MAKAKLKSPAGSFTTIPNEVKRAYAERNKQASTCRWIFEVDYAINSKNPRFFVYHLSSVGGTAGDLYMFKAAHGKGGKNGGVNDGRTREVSNVNGTGCSSLGIIRTLSLYTSDKVGRALRLEGLSSGLNDNIQERGIVMHGGDYVVDDDSNPAGRSLGCIVTDDRYIHHTDGGELLDVLANGSIGMAHYGGKFKI